MFSTYRVLWMTLVANLLILICYGLFGLQFLNLPLNILVLGVAVTSSAAWFPVAIAAITRGAGLASDKIALSIWAVWTILTIQRFYALALLIWKRPDALVGSPIQLLIVANIIIAGIYASYATVTDSEVVHADRTWTLISTFLGGIVAGGVAVYMAINGLNFG